METRIFRPPLFLCLISLAIPPLSAAPAIASVMNAASNIDPRMPNASLAPGCIFIVKGTGLGPAALTIAPAPFQSTSLSNTSVKLTVNGTAVDALMYYTSATQIAALLPSNTPTGGPVSITVTYNGQSSPATPTRGVAARNLALFTVDSTGTGPAIVTYPDYSLVSPTKAANCGGPYTTCGAANPGDTLTLWGTGLGAINGSDAAGAGLGQNMPNIPLSVWLGGVQAQVVYQGRSGCCVGEDQIVFIVPNNAPTGCAVPLVMQINNQVSNSTLMPVAAGSRTCTPSNPALAAVVSLQQLATLSSFNVGMIELDHFLNNSGSGYSDQGQFNFAKVSGITAASQPLLATYFDQQPAGTCTVIGSHSPGDTFFHSLGLAPLDGGSSFTINGPNGSTTVPANPGDKPLLSAAGTFLTPGNYTVTGAGGKDVGAFSVSLTIPITPTLTSPASNNLTVTRANGMTVTWNSNGSTGQVEMVLSSAVDANTRQQAVCLAPASAGSFTIPAYVLLALPPGNHTNFFFQPGSQDPATSAAFSASGLDAGIAQTFMDGVILGGFALN